MSAQRALFMRTVLENVGAPYVWGGKGAVVAPYGLRAFDCSGLVTYAYLKAGGPDWRLTHNTDKLWAECKAVESPRAGTLCLYGKAGDPSHVMIWVAEGVVVGASGGGSNTTSIGLAQDVGARVKVYASVHYRPDFIGYRELPWAE